MVAVVSRPAGPPVVLQGCLNLVLVDTGSGEAHRLHVTPCREFTGTAQTRHLVIGLEQPHLAEHHREVADLGGDGPAVSNTMVARLVDETVDPGVVMLIPGLVPDHLPSDHEPSQHLVELVELIGGVGAESFLGPFHPGPVTVPGLHLGVEGPDEEGVIAFGVAGGDDRNGLRLGKTGEIEEVRILMEVEGRVVAAGHLDGGRDHGDTVDSDDLGQPTTTCCETVRHGANGT